MTRIKLPVRQPPKLHGDGTADNRETSVATSERATGRGPPQAAEQALLAELAALLHELHPRSRRAADLHLDARLDRDLGLDSLARMELLARLEERFQVELPEQAGFAARTPSDLLRALGDALPRASAAAATAVALVRKEPLERPTSAQTLAEVLVWHAERHPQRLHVRFEGGGEGSVELCFGALHTAAQHVAAGLQMQGLRPAEPVALMLPTHRDFLVGFFGVMLAGGVPVPLYPPQRPSELAEHWRRQAGILRNCGARFLVGNEALHAHRHLVSALAGGVERLLTVSELSARKATPDAVVLAADDLALLQYTSGSTADPKGVMVSHRNMLANLRAMGELVGVDASDTFVSWLPLYHDMGLIGAWLGCLYYGTPLVLMSPQSFLLRPERWLWAIHRYRATLTAAPNFAYELCTHRIADSALDGLDLSSLRLAFCGAEPVFAETLERFAARFTRYGFRREALLPVYGLAENTLGLTFPPPGRGLRVLHAERDRFLETGEARPCPPTAATLSFVSCGLPLPGHELRIVDEGERELPDARQGRVQFQGPSACAGYYRNPEATRALKNGAWHDSGDLGFVHEGELYLTGRVKDLIIRAGRHLHPQGLEQGVGELPGVRRGRVAVFGALAPSAGTERLIVVAETRLSDTDAREALRARIQIVIAALTGEPADEVVLAAPGAVLKTSSGKLRRTACRAAYESGRLGARGRWPLLAVLGRGLLSHVRGRLRRARALLFAGYAWAVFGLLAPPAVLAVALLPSLRARWRAVRALLELLRLATGTALTLTVRAPPPAQPCIFVANHASYLDALLLVCTLPRPVAFVAKEELARWPLLRWLLPRFGAVFVARFDPARCTAVVAEARRAGRDFLFFPEGTFRRMPGLLPFHLGAFAAAAEGGLPIVPIALRGTRSILRGDDLFPRHGPLAVTIGAPIRPEPGADRWSETLRLAGAARAFLLAEVGEPDLGEAACMPPHIDPDQRRDSTPGV